MLENTLDLLRATEASAIAASEWIGTGDKLGADKAATDAMRKSFNRMKMSGRVVIGEGKKDESFGLFGGEEVGQLVGKQGQVCYDIAVDPIDGTRPTVTTGPEALSVLAVAEEDSLFATEAYYMHKLAYGPEIAKKTELKITQSLDEIIKQVSQVTGKDHSKIVVCMLDRPRHLKHINVLRSMGVRMKLIQDCDISGAIATSLPDSGIDLLYGVGGAPEAVISACAMKCLKGGFLAQIATDEGEVEDQTVYRIEDMAKGKCSFAATGITNGSLLKGVRFSPQGPVVYSVMMRSESGTVRWITSHYGH